MGALMQNGCIQLVHIAIGSFNTNIYECSNIEQHRLIFAAASWNGTKIRDKHQPKNFSWSLYLDRKRMGRREFIHSSLLLLQLSIKYS